MNEAIGYIHSDPKTGARLVFHPDEITVVRDAADTTDAVLAEVRTERKAQDAAWGPQNHPLHDVSDPDGVALLGRSYAGLERICKERFRQGPRTGAVILLEEVFEALAARNPEDIREELVQVAAVAVMLVEAHDRKYSADDEAECLHWKFPGAVCEHDDRPTEDGVRRAECTINDQRASTDDVAAADAVLRPAEDCGEWVAYDPADDGRKHEYGGEGRLHGICRCGEGREAEIHRTATPALCDGCGHTPHVADKCTGYTFNERCECDEPINVKE